MTHPRAEGLFTEHDRVQTQTSREVAEAELAYAEAVLARRVLRAPVDGTVFKRLVTEGEVVDPGRTLFIVDETSTLIVDCALIASEISRVSRGDEVWVTANEQRLAGRVAWVSDAPENDGALYTLRVRLDASALGLPLGLLVSVEFPSSATGQAIHVGLPALLNRNDHDYVFVVAEMGSESVAALRQVELGRAAGQATRVLKGLSPGERIIAEGGYFISDGQPVSITQ